MKTERKARERTPLKPVSAKDAAIYEKMTATDDISEFFALLDQTDPDVPEGFDLAVELDKDRRALGERPLIDWDDPRNAGLKK